MRYRFGEHVLDVGRRELRRGAALVSVEPQVFDLIVYLIRNRDRVATKDDLIEAIWGGRIVSDSALTTRINAARTAIGDTGKTQDLIKTLPRKGFRFIGEVREETASPDAREGVLPAGLVIVRGEARTTCVLMGDDELVARNALRHGRETVISAMEGRGARILETPTDTVVATFSGAAVAVAATCGARQLLAEANQGLPEETRVHYRFGVATGDFDTGAEGADGSAVARAAELGLRAHPDAIRLSESVQAALGVDPSAPTTRLDAGGYELMDERSPSAPSGLPAPLYALDLSLPSQPSIVLLPFKRIGDEQEETEALAEGLRLDIQNALTKMSGVFLIGQGSAYAMRGLSGPEAAARAGVRYVLEGNVQRAGDRVRVSVQVTDTIAGTVRWSDQYDCVLDGSFVVQDEITAQVVTALNVKLASGEQARVWHKCLTDPKARQCFYRGIQAFVRMNQESIANARACFLRLTELAPDSPFGPTWTALCLWFESTRGWAANPIEAREQAGTYAERAIAMEDADGQAHTVLGNVRLLQRRFDEALAIAHEALEIRPGCTNANGFLANVLLYCGEPRRAVVHARRAIRYMPVYPPWFVEILAAAYRDATMPDLSVVAAREIVRIAPASLNGRLTLASALIRCGWTADARRVAAEACELDANLTLAKWAVSQPYRDASTLSDILDELGRLDIPR
ncbi:MAG: winged helix-turn-helix domain-containing protein [Xanthobacteraceae bacterium]